MEIFNPVKPPAESAAAHDDDGPPLTKGAVLSARVIESSESGKTILKAGPRVIQAVLSEFVKPGAGVRVMVMETAPELVLGLLPDEDVDGAPAPGRYAEAGRLQSSPARSDYSFMARVLDFPSRDRVKIRIINLPELPAARGRSIPNKGLLAPGREISAGIVRNQSGPDLKPGQDIMFSIKESSPRLVLQVESGKPPRSPIAQALSGFINNPDQFVKSIENLMQGLRDAQAVPQEAQGRALELLKMLESLSPKPGAADNDFLSRLTGLIGLKGQNSVLQEDAARFLNDMLRLIDSQADESRARVFEAAVRVFEAVENLRGLNQASFTGDQNLHLAFPVFWPSDSGRGELQLKLKDQSSRPGERPYRITFLLDLTKMGKVKIDLEIKDKKLNGAIWTETPGVQSVFHQTLDRLTETLESRGIKVESLSASVFPQNSPPPVTLAGDLIPRGEGLIDVKV